MFRRLSKIFMWPLHALSRLTREGGLFAALALLCGLLSVGSNRWSNIPLLVSLTMLSMLLLALWQGAWSLRGIHMKRSHLERTFANEAVTVTLQLSNFSRLPSAGLVISEQLEAEDARTAAPRNDAVFRQEAGGQGERAPAVAHGSAFIAMLPGKGHAHARYSLMPRRRGIFRFGDTKLETFLPFWFFHSAILRRATGRLVVYPRLGELDSSFLKELDLSLQHLRQSRPSRAEEEFRGLREYCIGDNPKWIHWRSSARVQKLLVKEFEEPRARRVLVLLDTNLQRMGIQRFPAFETAISFAGTLGRDMLRRGYEVEYAVSQAGKRASRLVVSRERRNLDALLELLAGLKRDDSHTLADLMDPLGRRALHNVYVLVLGLGSLRAKISLNWLRTEDNTVKLLDVRSADFRHIFNRSTSNASIDDMTDEDLLPVPGEEEAE